MSRNSSVRKKQAGTRGWPCGAGVVESLESRRLLTVASVASLPDVGLPRVASFQALDLKSYFSDAADTSNTVYIHTTLGDITVQLTPDATPHTVENFLSYVKAGSYDGTFFHRSVPGFVIQAGGYEVANDEVVAIPTNAPVANEPGQSNVRGTIAMAKLGTDPDSATSQFFFNLADNSTYLDYQNGGFTVFGHVVGDQSLAVLDSIAAVPRVNADGAFSELPVIDYQAGQQTVPLDQLVYVNSVTQGTRFIVSSDNPAVLNLTLYQDRLTYVAQTDGFARVTVTAQTPDGQAVSQTFSVTVGAGASAEDPQVVIGNGGAKSLTFRDRDGTLSTLSLRGPGSAAVHIAGSGVSVADGKKTSTVTGSDLSIGSIVLTNATKATVVSVTTKGGNGSVDVGGVVSTGALGSIDGKGVNLTGATIAGGAIKSIKVKSASPGSSITAGSLGALSVSANSAADLSVSGALATASVSKRLAGTWRVGSLRKLAAGTIDSALISTTAGGNSVGSVSAKNMTDTLLRSAGNIQSLLVTGSMTRSQVFAGLPADAAATPQSAAAGRAQILSIKIGKGRRGNAFADSAIAAKTIRSVTLGNLPDVASDADFYGIEADTIVSLTGFIDGSPFSLKNTGTQSQADSQLSAAKVSTKNVRIVLV